MSHRATSWAFEQRGLKPATRLILVYLADCHNTHTRRCDPSQNTLAEQCEMARSTVNLHLGYLENLGLIRRVQRFEKASHRKKNTFYILGCDEDLMQDVDKAMSENRTWKTGKAMSEKQQKPCPKNGKSHVRTVGHKPEYKPEGNSAGAREASDLAGIATFWAQAIKDGKAVPVSAISPRLARFMLEQGFVDEGELKKYRIDW